MSRKECYVYGAAFEEEIGDNIRKGDLSRKFKEMGHGYAFCQAVLRSKGSVK